ncbi:MAG TPA: hypothetical protein VF695_05740 [Sphingomonas sp.]
MARPLTRAQCLENAAFLRALARTGNVRLAARETGIKYGTIQHRRRQHPAFATRWDAALATAQARINARGKQGPVAPRGAPDPHRTRGGEPVVVRTNGGRLQVRRAQPGKLTKACEQAFLSALSASANISLSAAAAGAAEAAFYRRRRTDPGFAREWRLALQEGYDRLEQALTAGFLPEAHRDDAWRHNEPPDMPPMTTAQALQLMYLHQKEARLIAEQQHVRRRRGESREAHAFRLTAMWEERQRRYEEASAIAQAKARARGAPGWWTDHLVRGDGASDHDDDADDYWDDDDDPPGDAPQLPDLAQVTGWSRADPAKAPHGDAALFGGWRVEDLSPEQVAAAKTGLARWAKRGRG